MNSGYVARIISSQKIYGLYGLKHHIVEMRGGVTDAGQQTTERTVKIELLSQWKQFFLQIFFRNFSVFVGRKQFLNSFWQLFSEFFCCPGWSILTLGLSQWVSHCYFRMWTQIVTFGPFRNLIRVMSGQMTKRQKDKERLGKRPNFPNYSRSYIYIHTRTRHLWSIRWYCARLPLVVPVRISQAPSPSPWRISTLTLPTHSAAPPHCVHLTLSKVGGLHSTPPLLVSP